ncbi:MAG: BamA/TamA family outer membrane protein, partial [Saprospiraceae bacterium]|nr:BamA/TamA family outer membrane protein [Saprospiraceae bacterium]
AGFKTIEPNPAITELSDPADPEFNFSVLYDSLEERSTQYRLVGQLEQFFPLFQSSALLLRNRSGWILSPGQAIYRNEQFRIGGNRLLRGFDEESLFVTLYSVFSLEYRLLIDRNSYFYLFGDYGYIEDRTVAVRRFDRPLGFGAGLSFETRAGIFGISLAIGRQQDNPVDFRNPKVHFGYVSLF